MSRRAIVIGSAVLSLAVVACAQDDTTQTSTTTRTERQKDSILAGSQIPGARAVKKAMTVADSASARGAAVIDTTPQNP